MTFRSFISRNSNYLRDETSDDYLNQDIDTHLHKTEALRNTDFTVRLEEKNAKPFPSHSRFGLKNRAENGFDRNRFERNRFLFLLFIARFNLAPCV